MKQELQKYREEIAVIDEEILRLIKKRLNIAREVGELKRREKLGVVDYRAEAIVLDRAERIALREGLDPHLARRLASILIEEAVNIQGQRPKNRARYLYSVFEKAEAVESLGRRLIRLDVGEPDIAAPPAVKNALRDSLYDSERIGYVSSKGLPELRMAIADLLNQRYGTQLSEDQVLVTPGGKFAVFAAVLAMVAQGDRAVVPEPTWPVYGNAVRLAGGREDCLHTRFEDGWSIDLGKLHDMCRVRPRILVLCSPNNPTGKIFDEKLLREAASTVAAVDGYVLTDEVYESYSSTPTKSILEVADSNFIYVNTFSKRYGMTGWRVGYAVSDAETINRMQSVLQLSVTCVPEFIQRAALEALKMDQAIFNQYTHEMLSRVNQACEELDRLPLEYVRPDGGMYLYPRARGEGFDSEAFTHRLIEEKGVVVTPGAAFGDYPEHFRISLGTNIEEIRRGIGAIGESLNTWSKE
jgi:aspartate aminotransferase